MWSERPTLSETHPEVVSSFNVTVSDDRFGDTSCPWMPPPLVPSYPTLLDSHSSFSNMALAPKMPVVLPRSIEQADLNLLGGDIRPVPIGYAPSQETRAPGLLDTRKWSQFAPDLRSHNWLPLLHEFRSLSSTPLPNLGPETHTQLPPDIGSSFPGLTTFNHGHSGTDHGHDPSSENGVLVSFSSGFAEDRANFVSDEARLPGVQYHTAGCHYPQRAHAVDIEGLRIDKDDLYPATGQGSGSINVHECQWASPCGMWIVSSRARIGAHLRKWHKPTHVANRIQCLWDGCTATAMRKDSIGRHILTAHLGEGFHCQGCNKVFSRKDVYDQHVQKANLCRDVGATTVFGTECKVIDARGAFQPEVGVRYAG